MRQIILDTETTGIGDGHRIIEIGAVELINRQLTQNRFHTYLNPERKVDEGAFRVHGISTEFLQDKPLFSSVAQTFIEFIEGSELIIHNAAFDVGFLNAEFKRMGWLKTVLDYCTVLDTLGLAKEKHPGQRNNLDALCKRYDVDNSNRQLHGALLDAEILAFVYLAMTGGQGSLFMEEEVRVPEPDSRVSQALPTARNSPVITATEEEAAAHNVFIDLLVKKSGVNYWEPETDT